MYCLLIGWSAQVYRSTVRSTAHFVPNPSARCRLGMVTGGWVGCQMLIGVADVNVDVVILKASGEIAHSGVIALKGVPATVKGGSQKPENFHTYGRSYMRLTNLWNDPEAQDGEYTIKLKVSSVEWNGADSEVPVLMLTHLYWTTVY